jgi:uncharacterized integral membrane protein
MLMQMGGGMMDGMMGGMMGMGWIWWLVGVLLIVLLGILIFNQLKR